MNLSLQVIRTMMKTYHSRVLFKTDTGDHIVLKLLAAFMLNIYYTVCEQAERNI